MKVTRVIAVGVILGSLAVGALNAQALRNSSPPAEFPPGSFKGKQYVDSRGCIYIRAGIDGNVTWVPRVSRTRKQVCGYKPTAVTGTLPTPAPRSAVKPVIITATPPVNQPASQPASTTVAASRTPAPALVAVVSAPQPKPSPAPAATVVASPKPATPKPVAAPRPAAARSVATAPTQRKPSPGPAPTVISAPKPAAPKPAVAPVPRATAVASARRKPSAGPAPTVISSSKPAAAKAVAAPAPRTTTAQRKPSAGPLPTVVSSSKPAARRSAPTPTRAQAQTQARAGNCSNASAFSKQYINSTNGRNSIRCGPQAEPPVTYRQGEKRSSAELPAAAPSAPSTANLSSAARVMPPHVYQNRQNTANVSVPSGYKPVWDDDRLNPKRAEWTMRPAKAEPGVAVVRGYKVINWGDGRLNPNRGLRTAQGEAQTDQIWSNTVPRTLLKVPAGTRVRTVPGAMTVQDPETLVTRLSTRSAPSSGSTTPPATPRSTSGKRIYVRVAVYANEGDARTAALALKRTGMPLNIAKVRSSEKRAVLVGPFGSDAEARTALAQVKNAGFRRARLSK